VATLGDWPSLKYFFMLILIFLGCVVLGALGAGGIVYHQLVLVKGGRAREADGWLERAEANLDRFYWRFARAFVASCHYVWLSVLAFLHFLARASRWLAAAAEKRFSRMIEAVRGTGLNPKAGQVSLFLSQIKPHKEALAQRTK
jgi:hypothetical protein